MFDRGNEFGWSSGLDLIRSEVRTIVDRKEPKNCVDLSPGQEINPLFLDIASNESFYFVHSFAAQAVPQNNVLARVPSGSRDLAVAVSDRNVICVRFHREWSGRTGLGVLRNFMQV